MSFKIGTFLGLLDAGESSIDLHVYIKQLADRFCTNQAELWCPKMLML